MIDKKNQAGWTWSFLSIFSIKDYRNWSVIDQLNLQLQRCLSERALLALIFD